jgi:hypothetical protein
VGFSYPVWSEHDQLPNQLPGNGHFPRELTGGILRFPFGPAVAYSHVQANSNSNACTKGNEMKRFILAAGGLMAMLFAVTAADAQVVTTYYSAPVYSTPVYSAPVYSAPITTYRPVTSYYAPSLPVTSYYAPATTVAAPTTTYYAPATTTYYAPTTTYYAPGYVAPVGVYGRPVSAFYSPYGGPEVRVAGQPLLNTLRAIVP